MSTEPGGKRKGPAEEADPISAAHKKLKPSEGLEEAAAEAGEEAAAVPQPEQPLHPLQYAYLIQPLGGDGFSVKLSTPRAFANEVKAGVEKETGIQAYRIELYKVAVAADGGVVREDDAEPELLSDSDEIDAGVLMTLLAKEAISWDSDWMGDTIELSEEGTTAICGTGVKLSTRAISSGEGVRSKEVIVPRSGVHCFQYIFTNKKNQKDGESLSAHSNGWDMVGVISASVPKALYSREHGLLTTRWWGLQNYGCGVVRKGGLKEGEECSYLPDTSKNKHGLAFGSGDRIGFAIDTDHGTMHFFRNDELIEGSKITGVPTNEPLFLVGGPNFVGTSVQLSVPKVEYDILARKKNMRDGGEPMSAASGAAQEPPLAPGVQTGEESPPKQD
jgi:hypothetical protein